MGSSLIPVQIRFRICGESFLPPSIQPAMQSETRSRQVSSKQQRAENKEDVLHNGEGLLKRVWPKAAIELHTKRRPDKISQSVRNDAAYSATLLETMPVEQVCILQPRVKQNKHKRVEMQERHLGIMIRHHLCTKAVQWVEVQN